MAARRFGGGVFAPFQPYSAGSAAAGQGEVRGRGTILFRARWLVQVLVGHAADAIRIRPIGRQLDRQGAICNGFMQRCIACLLDIGGRAIANSRAVMSLAARS